MENKHLKFEIDTINVEFLEQKGGDPALFSDDSQFATAKIRAFSSDWNRHNMYCSEEVLRNTAETIYYKPLIYVLDRFKNDFGSHSDPEESRPAGFVLPDSAKFVRLGDGRLSLEVTVKIWKHYAPTLMSIFRRDNGEKKVSVEMELFDYEEREDGILEMQDFAYMAITILGDIIQEGSPGANIEILSFSDELEKFRNDFLIELSSRYDSIDFKIPDGVKNNAKKGIELYNEYGKSDSRSLSNARYLIKNELLNPRKARMIYSIFNKSDRFKDMVSDPPSSDYIVYLLNGGNFGEKWIKDVYQKMSDLDEKSLSYFEKLTFPYNKKSDANPSLRKWNPPLSLGQMNEIARQADAIIASGKSEQSAWAIAISNFKKIHKIEDGKWVKKKESMEFNLQDDISKEKEVQMEEDKSNVKNVEQEKFEEKEEEKEEAENMSDEEAKNDDKPYMEAEKEESQEEEKDENEDEEEMCSPNFDFDVKVILDSLTNVEEVKSEIQQENINFSKIVDILVSNMSDLKKENGALKEFKQKIDEGNFNSEISETINGLKEKFEMTDDDVNDMIKGSENFSLEDLDEWKNRVKAKALDEFPLKKNSDKEDKEKINRYAFPYAKKDPKSKKSIWEEI